MIVKPDIKPDLLLVKTISDTHRTELDVVAVGVLPLPDPSRLLVSSDHVLVILQKHVPVAPQHLRITAPFLLEASVTPELLIQVEAHSVPFLGFRTCWG